MLVLCRILYIFFVEFIFCSWLGVLPLRLHTWDAARIYPLCSANKLWTLWVLYAQPVPNCGAHQHYMSNKNRQPTNTFWAYFLRFFLLLNFSVFFSLYFPSYVCLCVSLISSLVFFSTIFLTVVGVVVVRRTHNTVLQFSELNVI